VGKYTTTNFEVKSLGKKKSFLCFAKPFPLKYKKKKMVFYNVFMCKESFSSLLIKYVFELEVIKGGPCLVSGWGKEGRERETW
jgi:hypothetical protein